MKQSDPIYDLLSRAKTIAVVGLSDSPMRPSHGVSAYMQAEGYKIIPVNPHIAEALGEKAYPSLIKVPIQVRETIDLVDVFRRYLKEENQQVSQREFRENLAAKVKDPVFLGDTEDLLRPGLPYDYRAAHRLI